MNLKNGDNLFVIDENNSVIAVTVDDVLHEDNMTIIRKSTENVEEVFDFIKFETIASTNSYPLSG